MSATTDAAMPPQIGFTLDTEPLTAHPGESLLQAARRHGKAIPHLCDQAGLRAVGNCRACLVEIEGEATLAAACCRQPRPGMVVHSANERARQAQRLVIELLCADRPDHSHTTSDELTQWAEFLSLDGSRFAPRQQQTATDRSHPAIAVNLNACIHCTRCLRACREVQVNNVIGYAGRGSAARIVFDLDDPLGASHCVGCGECVQVCPTAALIPANQPALQPTPQPVDSLCPYCGVGCQLTYHVRDQRILWVSGRNGPANLGRLCIKGRYGFDYVHDRQRLTVPLIRRVDAPKRAALEQDPDNPWRDFREASWQEALAYAAAGLQRIQQHHGASALAGFGSAKGSNEEAYLFQKLMRAGLGSNNVDHCTRLCHASSVAALLEMIGSGAVSNPVRDVEQAEVIIVMGSNTTANHPVAASFLKNAAQRGKTLIVLDPRRTPMAQQAQHYLPFKPGSDVALLNAMMHVIIEQGLVDQAFVSARTQGFAALAEHLQPYTAEKMAPICGIDAATIRAIARLYGEAKTAMIFWGMGVSQHIHGTDNARALISLALICGQIGRPGTGLHPLRGQNNVQGASDAGLIPMMFPDYQRVDNPAARKTFETLWGRPLDATPGLTVVEIMRAITAADDNERIRGMYIMGENPAMSDPDLNHTRAALARLQHLVVQDIFMTETAYYADVILPASAFPEKTGSFTNTDRRVQLGRAALDPPGAARRDLDILIDIGRLLGLEWDYQGPREVFNEMRQAMPSIAGITWERLQRDGAVTYPCRAEGDPGQPVLFATTFPTPDGRARLVPAVCSAAAELPDAAYPWVLITGRLLEHWHTGAMSRRASVLERSAPEAVVMLHPGDLASLGAAPGTMLRLTTRRGAIHARAGADPGLQSGQVFLPFCYHEAAANLLTQAALDPTAKIPEFKFCALQISLA
jgi:formate dehydrogenase major subunit